MAESADSGTAIVQTHLVWKRRPGESRDLQVVVQELHQLPDSGPDLAGLRSLLDGVEVEADVVDAASRRPDDRVEILEALDEKGLARGGILLEAAVGHGLPAAGLLERVLDR